MRRFALVLFWLANYLLVLGAGLGVRRPERFSLAAQPVYHHSADCEQTNYLRLDCFDHCNGEQQAQQRAPLDEAGLPLLLTQLHGLDFHCLPTARPVVPAEGAPCPQGPQWATAVAGQMPAGVRMPVYAPPRPETGALPGSPSAAV